MKKNILAILFLVFICACSPELVEVSREKLGKIIDVSVIPTSFNEDMKIQIKTKSIFVVISGIPTVNIGAEAYKITYDNGAEYFTWVGCSKLYRIP